MNNPLLARFDNAPALLAPEMKGIFESCLNQAAPILAKIEDDVSSPKMLDGDDFWFAADDWRSVYRPYVVKNGILHIPVKGVLLHDFPWQLGGWATGYDYIWQAVKRGQADGNVRGLAFICDTPGGMVAGCFECVDRIHAIEKRKPLRGYAMESAYSAGYAIISVADVVTVSRTGGVGSIGVVTAHVDVSAAMDKMGVKVTFIFAGDHKVDGNPYEALKPEVKDRIQARIDELYGVFVSTVARNRAMDEQAVRDTKALTFTATQAVSNKLADSIGSLDDAIAAFAVDLSNSDEEEDRMITQEQLDAAVASAHTEGKNEGKAEGLAEGQKLGATAERTRINAIIGSDAGKDRPKAALSAALMTNMSVEEASAFLANISKEPAASTAQDDAQGQTTTFEQAMDQTGNPGLGSAEQGDQGKGSRAERAMLLAGYEPKSNKAA